MLEQWSLIKADLLSEYGVDVHDETLMRSRPWAWLRDLIVGLLSAPVAWQRRDPQKDGSEVLVPMWRTRVQAHLYGGGI